MQLSDIVSLVTQHGAERFMQKRAGVMLPLAVGAMLPGIAQRALEKATNTRKTMDQASEAKIAAFPPQFGRAAGALGGFAKNIGNQMLGQGIGTGHPSGMIGSLGQMGAAPIEGVASGVSGGIGESIKRMMLGREFGERKDPLHLGGSAAISAFGKEMGTSGANLLRDIANKAMETAGHAGDEAARQAILGDLKRTDSVLSGADDKILMEAYHTMARFAPVLSTDKNAVRSFLRQAVMSGSGPDYMSIKLIADSERSVTGGKDK